MIRTLTFSIASALLLVAAGPRLRAAIATAIRTICAKRRRRGSVIPLNRPDRRCPFARALQQYDLSRRPAV